MEIGAGVPEIWCIERDGDREWRLKFGVHYDPTQTEEPIDNAYPNQRTMAGRYTDDCVPSVSSCMTTGGTVFVLPSTTLTVTGSGVK